MDSKDKKKRIIFDDSTMRHAQLKIRLEYDGLTQAEFFRCLLTGYLNKDAKILSFLDNYKQENKKHSKRKSKLQKDNLKKSDDLLQKFSIKDDELENIFDLIEEEFPDL